MRKVLVVEDDQSLADLLQIHLADLSLEVTHTASGREGYDLGLSKAHDLIVLDLMLPDMNGMDVCRKLRMEKVQTPIIMLTAKSEEIDKVLGLETGADDYITKPFSVREFIARIKAIMRRTDLSTPEDETDSLIEHGNLAIDQARRIVTLSGERVELTPKEFDLLVLLATHPGRSYSRQQLLDHVWGYQFEGYEHTVNSHINRLRGKIEKNPAAPDFILTTWGIGYRFTDSL